MGGSMLMLAAVAMLARTMLALVFLQGFAGKVGDVGRLAGTVADYRLLPAEWALPAAWLLAAAEGLAGSMLLAGDVASTVGAPAPAWLTVIGAGMAGLMLGVFAVAMAITLGRGRRLISCGCHAAPTPLSRGRVALTGSLALLALPAALPLAGDGLLSLQAVAAGGLFWVMLQAGDAVSRPRAMAGGR